MFRGGGEVNSKGTGITSGLVDRVPYKVGGTTLDPYLAGPLTPPPANKELGFSQKFLTATPTSPVGQLFKNFNKDESTASEFTKFIEESRPEIRKEGTEGFKSLPIGSAEGLPIVTSKQTTKKEEETSTPDLTGGGDDEPTKINLDDLDDFEANVDKKAEMFLKRLVPEGARAQAVFKAFTAAADPLLRGEYGEAIKEAGDKLGEPGSLKEKVNLLAIQSELEDQKLRLKADLDKETKVTANIADYEYQVNTLNKDPSIAFQQVFGKKDTVQNREAIEDVRANSFKLIRETGTGVMKEYDTQYANAITEFVAGGPNYIKYKKIDPQKPSTADNLTVSTPLAPNQIYADPIFGGFAIMSGGQQLRFTTIEEAEKFINQARG